MQDSAGLTLEDSFIFDIQFSFFNKDMLKLLSKRARKLRQAKYADARKIEQKMQDLKDAKLDYIRTPNRFFCTFE